MLEVSVTPQNVYRSSCHHLPLSAGSGGKFRRRTFTFGFGTGAEQVEVRLKPDVDSVIAWRKDGEGSQESWHEIDIGDIKIIEPKGERG